MATTAKARAKKAAPRKGASRATAPSKTAAKKVGSRAAASKPKVATKALAKKPASRKAPAAKTAPSRAVASRKAPAAKAAPSKAVASRRAPAAKAAPVPSGSNGRGAVTSEERFWQILEQAWSTQADDVNAQRAALADREPGDEIETALVDRALDGVIAALKKGYGVLDQDELVAMDRVLEERLYAIDRAEIQQVTDGSDDGFLYARGYIVALGKRFYDAVNRDPSKAVVDAECEEMCYLPAHVHEQRFGDYPDTGSTISRESCSNAAGWPEAGA
jgi:hypothetical protein